MTMVRGPFNEAIDRARRRREGLERYIEDRIARMGPRIRQRRAWSWEPNDVAALNVWCWIHRQDLWELLWLEDRHDVDLEARDRFRIRRNRQERALTYAVDRELARRVGRPDAVEDISKWSRT